MSKAHVALLAVITVLCGCQTVCQPPQVVRLPLAAALPPDPAMNSVTNCLASELTRQHYSRPAFNDALSAEIFDKYISKLDPSHILFTHEDLQQLAVYRDRLDDEILANQLKFAYVAGEIAMRRANELLAFAKADLAQRVDTRRGGTTIRDRRKAEFPAAAEQRDLWHRYIVNELIKVRLENRAAASGLAMPSGKTMNPYIAHLPEADRVAIRLEQYTWPLRSATSETLAEAFLTSLTLCCDPHCVYASPVQFSKTKSSISLQFAGIGLSYSMNSGYCEVEVISKGGPIDKQGCAIKAGDIILAVAEAGKAPQSLVGLPRDSISDYLRGSVNSKIQLTVLDGDQLHPVPRLVEITRGAVAVASSRAQGKISEIAGPDGRKLRIGVVTLPIFYFAPDRMAGASDDIRAILADFQKQGGVDGVILDLRSNPGGLLPEAIKVAGLFIPTGPMVQVKSPASTQILNDPDPAVAYAGPMVVMINKMSASASEIVSGALKDYSRAIIVGDQQTYGKGTVQSVLDLRQFKRNYKTLPAEPGGVNLTTQMFYRPSGASTQFKGVASDIILPAFSDVMKDLGEAKQDHAIPFNAIPPATYTVVESGIPARLPALREKSRQRIEANPDFNHLRTMIASYDSILGSPTVLLDEKKRWIEYRQECDIVSQLQPLLKLNTGAEEPKKDLGKDIYLEEALNIMGDYIASQKVN
jgi:carboxyl-terminal processing protease